jgi:Protein of unknown function (DUF3617)
LSDPIRTALLRGFCVVIAWVLAVGGARAEGLEAGLWKVVTKAEVNGVTAPNQETMRCLTPDDVKNLEATFSPNSRTTNSICETSEHEASPQRLKWRLQCKGQLDMDVAGEFVFDAPEHYTATITTRATMLGKEIQHSQASIEAQRVGACQ